MNQNVGLLDRIIRVIVAISLFYIGITFNINSLIRIIIALFGGVLIVTAVLGNCPLYSLLGIRTKKISSNNSLAENSSSNNSSETSEQK
jgi:hypothetical protein